MRGKRGPDKQPRKLRRRRRLHLPPSFDSWGFKKPTLKRTETVLRALIGDAKRRKLQVETEMRQMEKRRKELEDKMATLEGRRNE